MQEFYGALGFQEHPEAAAPPGVRQFCRVRIGRPARGTWTGLGLVLYGPDGRIERVTMDSLDRAIERRDAFDYRRISADELEQVSLRAVVAKFPWRATTVVHAAMMQSCPWQLPCWNGELTLLAITALEPADSVDLDDWETLIREVDEDGPPLAAPTPVAGGGRRWWHWALQRLALLRLGW